jgi:hypothetical protein
VRGDRAEAGCVEYCEREVDQAGRQAYACACISVLGQTTRRRLPIAGRLRASDRDRMLAALLAVLPAMVGPIVTAACCQWPMTWPMFCLAQACSSLPVILSELRYLTQPTRAFRFAVAS